MPGIVLLGAQWGDEGKGKVTDLMADDMHMVVRYQGGNNAGHTIICEGRTLKLHLIPSGILYPHIISVVGNGVVLNPRVILEEMENLRALGISTDNLRISCNAHLILRCHEVLDGLSDDARGGGGLGTTRRGIGPTYADKAMRVGLRAQDLLDRRVLREKAAALFGEKNRVIREIYGGEPLDVEEELALLEEQAEKLRPFVTDASRLVREALREGRNVLFEGAQGTLLDLDHGTYPYVTSSNPTAGGVCTGAGVGPRDIDEIIGVAKAYLTRVGEGPFPTEQDNEVGAAMQEAGREFGTTTGRKRRCGWLDLVLLRYAVRLNTLTALAITKLDVLSQFDELRVCVAYRLRGRRIDDFPSVGEDFAGCDPVYEDLRGWGSDISGAARLEDLPRQARDYLDFIREMAGIPIKVVSVGPDRRQTILVDGEQRVPGQGRFLFQDDLPF
jgi:adenylosuccinate synthase